MKKIIFVTGASSGIGKALSIKFANSGWKVLAFARRLDLLKKLDKECLNLNTVIPVKMDISNKKTVSSQINKTIKKYGAVSHQCCLAMVNNLSKISKAHVNVSITGIAGPKGGTKQKPVGLVYIGIKKGKKVQINRCLFKSKKRSSIQKATVKKTLDLILGISK